MDDVDLAEYGDTEDFPLHLDGGQLAYRTQHVRGESHQGATMMSRNHEKSPSALYQQSSART
jgi:hypothetical protein